MRDRFQIIGLNVFDNETGEKIKTMNHLVQLINEDYGKMAQTFDGLIKLDDDRIEEFQDEINDLRDQVEELSNYKLMYEELKSRME